jgi:hypothetical protein
VFSYEDASWMLAKSGFERLQYPALKQLMRLAAICLRYDYMMALLDRKIMNIIFVIPQWNNWTVTVSL